VGAIETQKSAKGDACGSCSAMRPALNGSCSKSPATKGVPKNCRSERSANEEIFGAKETIAEAAVQCDQH